MYNVHENAPTLNITCKKFNLNLSHPYKMKHKNENYQYPIKMYC